MQQPRIWLVEDEQSIADTLVYMLQQEGFQVTVFGRGLPALEAAAHQAPDVAILDVGLPDISGFELCRRLLTRYPALPVLFLTARSDEVDKLLGLEIGADDYVLKPFSPRELAARVKTILRRMQPVRASPPPAPPAPTAGTGGIEVDEERAFISFRAQALDLSRTEYLMLTALAARPEKVFSRSELMDAADLAEASLERSVDTHIKSLRAKLAVCAPDADPIRTHRGLGYCLARDAT